MSRQRTVVVVAAIVALAAFGAYYLATTTEPQPGVVVTIAAGIAGLGGYEVKQRSGGA
jgi:hypothetical protein